MPDSRATKTKKIKSLFSMSLAYRRGDKHLNKYSRSRMLGPGIEIIYTLQRSSRGEGSQFCMEGVRGALVEQVISELGR